MTRGDRVAPPVPLEIFFDRGDEARAAWERIAFLTNARALTDRDHPLRYRHRRGSI